MGSARSRLWLSESMQGTATAPQEMGTAPLLPGASMLPEHVHELVAASPQELLPHRVELATSPSLTSW